MGRVDTAVLSVRCACSIEKSLVLLWLSASRRRNAQRATVICGAFFYPLAIVAKKMDPRAARARRFHGDGSIDSFSVASAHFGSLDCRPRCCRRWLFIPSTTRVAASKRVDRRDHRMRSICDWRFYRRKLRLVTSWFYLRQRALSLPFH